MSYKIMTAAEAAAKVRSGDRVYVGTASSFAYELMDALWERKDELSDVTLLCSLSTKPSRIFGTKWEEGNPFRILTFFMGPWERIASRKNGVPLDYTSFHLSQVDLWCREVGKADICFMEMSRPDEEGYLSFGPSGCSLYTHLLETAREVYVEANARTPFIRGDRCTIHSSKVDGIILTDRDVPSLAPDEVDPISKQISELVLKEIPDGATLSLGVGGVPFTVAKMLAESDLKDLGCHTGTISDAYLALYKAGKLTNRRKEVDTGFSTWNLAMGSRELYDWLEAEPHLFRPSDVDYVHSPERMSQLSNFVGIMGGVQLDLMGQENAESAGKRQLSGIGGQLDFLEGAYRSKGGKGFVCLNSSRTDKDGNLKSNIVPFIPGGSVVSGPRTMIQYVATEYGVVKLSGLSLRERAEAMISVAHPAFRAELAQYAKDTFG